VTALREGFGISERRACEVVGQSRSSERRIAKDRPAGLSVAGPQNPLFHLPASVSA
jgi:hypothetical protein